MMHPLVAVVVTYRSAADVAACLHALAAELGDGDRLVVVDNASPDGTVASVRASGVDATLVEMGRNAGFGSACNAGAARAPGCDVLLVNPDAVVQPGAVTVLREALAADPRRGIAGPRIDRPDGGLDLACRRSFPDPATAFFRLSRLDRVLPHHPAVGAYNRLSEDPSQPGEIDSGCGAGLLVRREAWDAVGGFDESFFMYGEDLDLARRIRDAGWVMWYEPRARFLHRKGASSRQESFRMLYEFHRAMWLFYRKHYAHGGWAVAAPAVAAGVWGRFAALAAVNALRRERAVSR